MADLTYIRTWSDWACVAFVLDVYSRVIVGWQLASHTRTELWLDALGDGVVAPTDRDELRTGASQRPRFAVRVSSLLIEMQGPRRDADQVERCVIQWVAWYNDERLHSALDYVPPTEYEQAFWLTPKATTLSA